MRIRARLRRNWERVSTEPGLKKNVLTFVGLVVLALICGSIVLSHQRFQAPWADRYELSAQFEAVPGIAPGNGQEVRMNGVIVGQITGAHVDDDGHAVLDFSIEPGHPVYENATLVLRPKSPLNEMYVSIDPGGPPSAKVPSGGELPMANTRRPVQIDEVLGHLDDQSRAALTDLLAQSDDALAQAPRDLPAGLEATTDFSTKLDPVVTLLDKRRQALQRLVTAVAQIADAVGGNDQRIVSLAASLQKTLDVVSDESGPLGESIDQLPGLTRRLTTTTSAVRRLTTQLDPTLRDVKNATTVLPGALRKLTSTATHLRETVHAARPVVAGARPVVADLRPYSAQLASAMPALERTTSRLDPVTSILTKYLPDLGAFMVNTRSVTSLRDGNGGILRGMLEITSTSLPTSLLSGLSPDTVQGPLGTTLTGRAR